MEQGTLSESIPYTSKCATKGTIHLPLLSAGFELLARRVTLYITDKVLYFVVVCWRSVADHSNNADSNRKRGEENES